MRNLRRLATLSGLLPHLASTPPAVERVVEEWARRNRLGTPAIDFDPSSLVIKFPGWAGDARRFEALADARGGLVQALGEALDTGDVVMDYRGERYTVSEGTVTAFYPLKPYDPDEDGAF